jgi:hypothetical protein
MIAAMIHISVYQAFELLGCSPVLSHYPKVKSPKVYDQEKEAMSCDTVPYFLAFCLINLF